MTEPTETERQINLLRFAATLLSSDEDPFSMASATLFSTAASDLDTGNAVPGLDDLMEAAVLTIRSLS